MPVDRDALKDLMTSELLRAFEADVASRLGLSVVEAELWRDMHSAIGDLSAAGLQPDDVRGYIAANKEALAKFIMALHAQADLHSMGEFGEGDEPEDDDSAEVKVLGYGRGFSIGYSIYALLISDTTIDRLTPYLKNRRVPYATKENRKIRAAFHATHES